MLPVCARLLLVNMFSVRQLLILSLTSLMIAGDGFLSYAATSSRTPKTRVKSKIRDKKNKRQKTVSSQPALSALGVSDELIAQMEAKNLLIPDTGTLTPFEEQFNYAMCEVAQGKRGPEDIRINGYNLVWHAVNSNLPECVRYLAPMKPKGNVYRNGENTLHRAALTGNPDVINALMECCDSPPVLDKRCRGAWRGASGTLKRAAQSGKKECFDTIIGLVGIPTAERNNMSVIDNAAMNGDVSFIEHVEKYGWSLRPNEMLLRAVAGTVEPKMLDYLVKRGADVNYIDHSGYSVLMAAAAGGNEKNLSYVLNKLKDVTKTANHHCWTGDTVLHCAAASGNPKSISMVLSYVRDIRDSVYTGSVVENAAASGNIEAINLAYGAGGSVPDEAKRALCVAARFGHLPAVMSIVNGLGAPVSGSCTMRVQHARPYEDVQGREGVVEVEETTPLMAAIAGGNMAVVQFLVDRGADLMECVEKDGIKLTPLRAAARRGRPDMIEYLLANSNAIYEKDPGALTQAAENGNLACMKLLVSNGWDVNEPDPETGLLPIEAACCRGTDSPYSVNWSYDTGTTHEPCLEFLVNAGAKVDSSIASKGMMLALSHEVPMLECAHFMLAKGGRVPKDAQLAALHRVVEFDDKKLAKALLGGLSPREDADKRRSPLFTAYNLGGGCCADILIDAGEKLTREESEFLIRNGEQRTLNPPK